MLLLTVEKPVSDHKVNTCVLTSRDRLNARLMWQSLPVGSKVSLVSETRLLFDLAKQGWEISDSDGEDGQQDENLVRTSQHDEDWDVPLVKTTKQLLKVSR